MRHFLSLIQSYIRVEIEPHSQFLLFLENKV